MHRSTTWIAAMAFAVSPSLAGVGNDESPEAYAIVTAAAVPVLPPPLRPFFETHFDALRDRAVALCEPGPRTRNESSPPSRHYVMLDVAARRSDAKAKQEAARRFPRDPAAAMELAKRHGVTDGGFLPWVLHDRYKALSRAFRSRDPAATIREAGAVLHFAADAALPFHTTVDRKTVTGHRVYGVFESERHGHTADRAVRPRDPVDLPGGLYSRLEFEVRVAPMRYRQVSDPLNEIFAVLLDAYAVLPALQALDATAVSVAAVSDAGAPAEAAVPHDDRVVDRAANLMELQLERAALLAANLIGTAWAEAGHPHWDSPAEPATLNRPAPRDRVADFVGSRYSTVFHRAACSHAKRIKPANRIYFATADEALRAGRTPCRSCKPADP